MIATDVLYYSEPYWDTIMITVDGTYIPFSIVLETSQWSDSEEQSYSKFLRGVIDIRSVINFNENIDKVFKLANTLIKREKLHASVLWETEVFIL